MIIKNYVIPCTGYFASSPDPDTVVDVLNFFLSDEVSICTVTGYTFILFATLTANPPQYIFQVRDQDIIYGLSGISLECRETAWKWMKVWST